MSDRENNHARLMMLHKTGGEIEGRAKFHKLLFNYADEEGEEEDSEISFILEERGPFDPGLSKAMQRYEDIGLVDVSEDEEPHKFTETEKCERYMSGYERTKMRLSSRFRDTVEKFESVVRNHGDKSAYEMVKRENIQEAKENPLGKELE